MMRWLDARAAPLVVTVAVALVAAPTFAYAQASKRDAPISSKPTVRSEIKRGEDAAFQCAMHSGDVLNYSAFVDCINGAVHSNQQKSTNTDPFILGLYIAALVDGKIKNGGQEDSWVRIWRTDTARIIKAYKLTDADLCATFDMKCDAVKGVVSGAK